ncbi:MAG: ABC transporter substrate-binding protein [Myxococcales bacterium]|nr:ABC transporter substrate-binding protein [Myxococcales bacterium]
MTHRTPRTPAPWACRLVSLGAIALLTMTAVARADSPPPAAAGSAADAKTFLEHKQAKVMRLLRQAPSPAREKALDAQLAGFLDYETISKDSLAAHWQAASPKQRHDFVSLFEALVRGQYQANLQKTLDFDVRYEAAKADGERFVVKTVARSKTQRRTPSVDVDYTLRKTGDGYQVVDIATDGVSMVDNYRSQFGRIIAKEGFDGLIGRMRDKRAQQLQKK